MLNRIFPVLTLCLFGVQAYAAAPTLEELQAEITSLKATVTALQSQLSSDITKGNATLASYQKQINLIASNPALALGPFVTVDPNPENQLIGPHIIFHGANIHIVSGSGATNDNGNLTGLGNLIIGYNEVNQDPDIMFPKDRVGSHNLVIGSQNLYTSFGGIVAGEDNLIYAEAACVIGGTQQQAFGIESAIIGGRFDRTSGVRSVVVGGELDAASGSSSVVVGGLGSHTDADAYDSTILGGYNSSTDAFLDIHPLTYTAPTIPPTRP